MFSHLFPFVEQSSDHPCTESSSCFSFARLSQSDMKRKLRDFCILERRKANRDVSALKEFSRASINCSHD